MKNRFRISRLNSAAIPELPNPHDRVNWDYCDAFALIASGPQQSPADWLLAFKQFTPTWIGTLMRLRHAMVSHFGLKTEARMGANAKFEESDFRLTREAIKPGQKMGLFEIYTLESNLGVVGADDKHLDFRVGIWVERLTENQHRYTMGTWVKLHHVWGRFYFAFVKPVHRLIVPAMLRSAAAGLGLKP